jgi:hypothetical protein
MTMPTKLKAKTPTEKIATIVLILSRLSDNDLEHLSSLVSLAQDDDAQLIIDEIHEAVHLARELGLGGEDAV